MPTAEEAAANERLLSSTDLAITGEMTRSGNDVAFTMILSNNGPAPAGGVVAEVTLPPGVVADGVQAEGCIVVDVSRLACRHGDSLLEGEQSVFPMSFIGSSRSDGAVVSAVVTSSGNGLDNDPVPSNNTATWTVPGA